MTINTKWILAIKVALIFASTAHADLIEPIIETQSASPDAVQYSYVAIGPGDLKTYTSTITTATVSLNVAQNSIATSGQASGYSGSFERINMVPYYDPGYTGNANAEVTFQLNQTSTVTLTLDVYSNGNGPTTSEVELGIGSDIGQPLFDVRVPNYPDYPNEESQTYVATLSSGVYTLFADAGATPNGVSFDGSGNGSIASFDVTLTAVSVPEPSTCVLGLIGLIVVVLVSKRR